MKPCGGRIFPSCGPSYFPCADVPHLGALWMREAVGWQTKGQLYRAYRRGRSGRSQTRMLLMSGTVFFAGSTEYQVGSLGESSCSGCRKG